MCGGGGGGLPSVDANEVDDSDGDGVGAGMGSPAGTLKAPVSSSTAGGDAAADAAVVVVVMAGDGSAFGGRGYDGVDIVRYSQKRNRNYRKPRGPNPQ